LSFTILKFIFSLASKLGTYIPYLLSVAPCSKEKKREERMKESTFLNIKRLKKESS
jgi:hypothetical protein